MLSNHEPILAWKNAAISYSDLWDWLVKTGSCLDAIHDCMCIWTTRVQHRPQVRDQGKSTIIHKIKALHFRTIGHGRCLLRNVDNGRSVLIRGQETSHLGNR